MTGSFRAITLAAGVLAAGPALAETPLVEFAFSTQSLTIAQGTPLVVAIASSETGQTRRINFRLPDALVGTFGRLTGEHVDEPMGLIVCGRELNRPIIRGRIDSPNLAITGLGEDDAESVASTFARGRCE